MNPKISIIVTCYNYGQYISECIQSIQKQTFENWECLIMDDGSTDDTQTQASKFISDQRISYHYQKNAGVSSARNNGINKVTGTYVIFLDADDLISPNYMELLLKNLIENPDATLAYPEVYLFGKKNKKWDLPNYSYKALLAENMIVVSAMYLKSDFEKTDGFDEKMNKGSEDWELLIRLLNGNKKAIKVDKAILYYRIKAVSKNAEVLRNNELKYATFDYVARKNALIFNEYFETALVLHHKLLDSKKPFWWKWAKKMYLFFN